jgi:hypothetical protein
MGFENTNFIDDLGHDMKKDHPVMGCLGIILATALIICIPFILLFGAVNYTKIFQGFMERVEFIDAKQKIVFDAPAGWINFGREKNAEQYRLIKMFLNEQKSSVVLESAPYSKMKYTKKKMVKDTAGIARQIRALLKQKAVKDAEARGYSDADEGENPVDKVMDEYTGYKMVKSLYKNGYGYARYKKDNDICVYYFKPLKTFMMVMTYKFEDSEKYREQAKNEEEKLVLMWEKALSE